MPLTVLLVEPLPLPVAELPPNSLHTPTPLAVVATLINPLGPVLHTFTLPSLRLLAPDPGLPTLATLLLILTLLLLPQLLLALSLSHLSTLLLLLLALLLFTEEAAAAEAFFDEALRTQLSKLDTNVSSPAEAAAAATTPTRTLLLQTVVEGEAALYREAEVICLLIWIAIGAGDTDEDELAEVAAVDVVVEQEKDSIEG